MVLVQEQLRYICAIFASTKRSGVQSFASSFASDWYDGALFSKHCRLLMFDFLFRRGTKSSVTPAPGPSPVHSVPQQALRDVVRAEAHAVATDEAASVNFLLTCEFADSRLIAAQAVHSKDALQRVLKALRNSDRRVARLMQSRLDDVLAREKTATLAEQCIADATAMTTRPQLTSQQVGEIDRRWSALNAPPQALQEIFASARAVLGDRLLQQSELQRRVIDTLAALRHLVESDGSTRPDEMQTFLNQHEENIALFGASAEAINLPKNLLDECRVAAGYALRRMNQIQQRETHHAELVMQLEAWESTPPELLDPAALKREWTSTSSVISEANELQARFDALLDKAVTSKSIKKNTVSIVNSVAKKDSANALPDDFIEALQALERALAQGTLQLALDADRRLRTMTTATTLSTEHREQLSALRIRLTQLQSWARWGGNVSREELLKAAIALPEQKLSVVELAKKIGNLRQQWKALDVSAGAAPKELWFGFDAACTTAYAPVAEQHRLQSEARQRNSEKANAHIAALELAADQLETNAKPDWKSIAQLCQRAKQEWQRIGPTERRDKVALNSRFQVALKRLLHPLAQVQEAEQRSREALIDAASQVRAQDHGAVDQLRALQQQWQERAVRVPLDRREEQVLWQRFRAACDAVFAQRKEHAAADEQQRQTNLQARETICLALERSGAESISTLKNLLRESAASWSAAGRVPRGAQDALEHRYRHAIENIKAIIANHERTFADEQRQTILTKLELCQQLEEVISDRSEAAFDRIKKITENWQGLASRITKLDTAITKRFERALQAQRDDDSSYCDSLKTNQLILQSELMRLEILRSIESPPELAAERLKMQVMVLQTSLRDGRPADTDASELSKLATLPAFVDATNAARFKRVFHSLLDVNGA